MIVQVLLSANEDSPLYSDLFTTRNYLRNRLTGGLQDQIRRARNSRKPDGPRGPGRAFSGP